MAARLYIDTVLVYVLCAFVISTMAIFVFVQRLDIFSCALYIWGFYSLALREREKERVVPRRLLALNIYLCLLN